MKNIILNIPAWQWLILFGLIVLLAITLETQAQPKQVSESQYSEKTQLAIVLPEEGIVLPAKWGDLGVQLAQEGVIDTKHFEVIYKGQRGLSEDEKSLLYGKDNSQLKINRDNAGIILNLLWAFGLANQNPVLDEGPMQNPTYGGAEQFASTGGWVLSKGNVMDHYSAHNMVSLTPTQQSLIEEVAKNIYRPCCDNSTYFPDCNHGMAMLGLLELMASQGANEGELYRAALTANSYWFPDTYLTLAKYFESKGAAWPDVNPKTALGYNYSSSSGFRDILAEVKPVGANGGGSCGV